MITLVLYYKKTNMGMQWKKERPSRPQKWDILINCCFLVLKKLANYPFQVYVDHSQLVIVFTYNTSSINKHSNGF